MPPKEPTRAQLSSRLTYSQTTPAFLRKLQNKVAGVADEDDDDEFEDYGSGRVPIPKRPAIPQRPDDDPGSADEDEPDEAPQIVVLKEGRHLNQWQVENEKRKAKGLPPLPRPPSPSSEPSTGPSKFNSQLATKSKLKKKNDLSFSSGGVAPSAKRAKRKIGDASDDDGEPPEKLLNRKDYKKKQKKVPKVGLSFADDV
ncbi:hypothetical protein K488DRAFT_83850 [Vararia minispora EC-137]|uniref:Uncharacterized protein n=1 Tax=Vararia minispora EC-137 TaxID=1314806 RepID=A0ACB8QS42_9AGAM|nr:hypothetical protein K488DRAFT_83850 [Vararia minispora EC-137]